MPASVRESGRLCGKMAAQPREDKKVTGMIKGWGSKAETVAKTIELQARS